MLNLLYAPTPAPTPGADAGTSMPSAVSSSWKELQAHHLMSPTTVMVLIMLALLIDWMSFGPNSIRDRLAFLIAVPTIFEGFNGGPLDRFTVGAFAAAINASKSLAGDSYIAGADTQEVVAAVVGLLFLYALGCLMPERWATKLGPYARLAFTPSRGGGMVASAGAVAAVKNRLNLRLWACAFAIGVLCELPGGLVGSLMLAFVSSLDSLAAPLPGLLFGGA